MRDRVEVAETLGEVFAFYRGHAGVLLPTAFWVSLATAIPSYLLGTDLGSGFIALVIQIVCYLVYEAFTVGLVRERRAGESELTALPVIGALLPALPRLLLTGLVAWTAIFVGLILFVVPGAILLTFWAVFVPVIMLERTAGRDALRRSRELVRGFGWEVLGVIALAGLIALAGGVAGLLVVQAFSDEKLLEIVFTALGGMFTLPISALAVALLYYRLLALHPPRPAAADAGADDLPPPADASPTSTA